MAANRHPSQSAPVAGRSGEIRVSVQGIFWAGGEVTSRAQPETTENLIRRHHAYVEYFVPHEPAADAVPIVFAHTNMAGAIWRTTPDGREGWAEYFLRRGYPVFVVDPPGTGRAGFQIDDVSFMAAGGNPHLDANSLSSSDSSAWQRWNIGAAFGRAVAGGQFPTEPAALQHFLAALIPARTIVNEIIDAAFIAVLEKIMAMVGPAVFVGWSLAGGLGQRLAVTRPELLRGLVILEGGKGSPPYADPGAWFDNCHLNAPNQPTAIVEALVEHRLPLLSVNGEAGHAGNSGRSRMVCQVLVDAVNAAGGNATNVFLPDLGISGSSHMFFWEKNSDDIACVVANWIEANVGRN